MTTTTRYISVVDTAKLIRAALKSAFAGIKFSVKSSSYSGGASVRITWMDGPMVTEVERIIKPYEGATFDGMQDLKSYTMSELNGEKVHFGADYIFCDRSYSPAFLQRRVDSFIYKYGNDITLKVNEWGSTEILGDYEDTRRFWYETARCRAAMGRQN